MKRKTSNQTLAPAKSDTSRVSVRDVAAAAGTSIASVSRVLNESGYASIALRERVTRAIRSTGYTPNFAAKHLRTGRSRAVGVMLSNLANPFLSAFVSEVERRLQIAGYSVLVASTYEMPSKEEALLTLFESRQMEGIIAAPSVEGLPRKRNPFARCKLPLVIVDRDVDCDADFVVQDHRNGVRQAMEYLAALGHRRIALFGPSAAIRPGREKLLGYRDGLKVCGLDFDPALVCMFQSAVDSADHQMMEMLGLTHPPTALIGLGTRILSGALRAARRSGVQIPRDLSVVGIGTNDAFALMYPPMTTLDFNIDQVAQVTANLMLERLGAVAAIPSRTITVPLALVIGESCAVPPPRLMAL